MGNDNSHAITIDVDRNNLFYYSGETVSGIVRLYITEENFETREIYISLIGETGYTTKLAANGIGGNLAQGENYTTQFYYKKVSLSEPSITQQEFIYDRGRYEWLFQIPLIDNLPPTINQPDTFPHVRYFLRLVIKKPWYTSNIKYRKYLTVHPRVNLLENPQCLLPSIFKFDNRKGIKLKATFNKVGYVSGENIQFTLEIQNPRKILILHCNLSILQCYRIVKIFDECIIHKTILPKIVNLTNEHIMENFSIKIPSLRFPPSYKFQEENPNIFVHIYYMLKITVKVEGIFTNFHINVPITLGTECNSDLSQQQSFNPLSISYSSNPEQSICNDDDAPPDYDSFMRGLQ
ncbi:unnamed protein product [Rotaria sordida]|uniref:Arrestin C-terminal-like domain-containing protein n=1 Tax=Rotaria sordida TaxID=392033 RepID=A0A815C0X8_9BILA|nr:unnamed protein product [Rotaria sordida]CAF1613065.1 unnamed protein product [Rotaria sordida]